MCVRGNGELIDHREEEWETEFDLKKTGPVSAPVCFLPLCVCLHVKKRKCCGTAHRHLEL